MCPPQVRRCVACLRIAANPVGTGRASCTGQCQNILTDGFALTNQPVVYLHPRNCGFCRDAGEFYPGIAVTLLHSRVTNNIYLLDSEPFQHHHRAYAQTMKLKNP